MTDQGEIPRVEVTCFPPGVDRVRVEIEAGAPPEATPEVREAWHELQQSIPRLFNGGVLSVTGIDAAAGVIRARRDTYQRLVVQPRVKTGVRQLSVTGMVEWDHRIMLGRRSAGTRMYAGMWELGPAGGIEPPGAGVTGMTFDDIVKELRREAREEAGLEISPGCDALAVVFDGAAQSYDVVLCAHAAREPAAGNWEYRETRWLSPEELVRFERDHGADMIPPTRAIIREFVR